MTVASPHVCARTGNPCARQGLGRIMSTTTTRVAAAATTTTIITTTTATTQTREATTCSGKPFVVQAIRTEGARDWESFKIGPDHYIAVYVRMHCSGTSAGCTRARARCTAE